MNHFEEELSPRGQEKLNVGLNLVRQSYHTYSLVWKAFNNRPFHETRDRDLRLKDISINEVVPIDWLEDSAIVPDPFFYDIGRDLAIEEKKFLYQSIKENVEAPARQIPEINRLIVIRIVEEFVRVNNPNPVLLIPAELSIPLYIENGGVEFEENREFLRVSPNVRLQLLLLSKYVKSKDLLLIDKSFGRWIFLEGNYNSLSIETRRFDQDKFLIIAKTTAIFKIENPGAAHAHIIQVGQ